MNSVNLLPATRHRHGVGAFGSPAFFGLSGALALILVATVLYVSAENRVSANRTQLARLSSGVTAWSSVAASYSGASAEAAQRATALVDVQALASTRFDWSNLLGQIASRIPADAQLSSLQAAAPVAATATPTSATATPAVTTSTTSTTAAAAPATATASTAGGSTIQLSACATSQTAVAATMVALQDVSGVSGVTLTSSTDSGSTGGSGSGTSSEGCTLPVQFQLSLAFTSPAASSRAATAPTSAATTSAASTGSSQ